jgi:predicted Zn finger-like uncharacterized protein
MVIECPSCKTRFAIDAQQIAEVANPRFHCSRCNHIFELAPVELTEIQIEGEPNQLKQSEQAPAESEQAPAETAAPETNHQAVSDDVQPAPAPPTAPSSPLPSPPLSASAFAEEESAPEQLNLIPPQPAGEQNMRMSSTKRISRSQMEDVLAVSEESPLVTANWPDPSTHEPLEVDLSHVRSKLSEQEDSRLASSIPAGPQVFAQELSPRWDSPAQSATVIDRPEDLPPEPQPSQPAFDMKLTTRTKIDTFRPNPKDYSFPAFVQEEEEGHPEMGMPEPQPSADSFAQSSSAETHPAEAQSGESGSDENFFAAEEPAAPPPQFSFKETRVTKIDAILRAEAEDNDEPTGAGADILSGKQLLVETPIPPQQLLRQAASIQAELTERDRRKQAYQEALIHAVSEEQHPRTTPHTPAPPVAHGGFPREQQLAAGGKTICGISAMLLVCCIPALLLLGFWLWAHNLEHSPMFIKNSFGLHNQGLAKLPPPGLTLVDVKSMVTTLDDGKKVLEIKGDVLNATLKSYKGIMLESFIYDEQNVAVHRRIVQLNNGLANAYLNALKEDAIETLQNAPGVGDGRLRPNNKIPFRIVFTKLLGKETWFSSRVFSVEPG